MSEQRLDRSSRAAAALLACEDARADREPLTDEWAGLDAAHRATRCRTRRCGAGSTAGEQLIGVKLGLTSRAKQQRMDVSAPLIAWLTDAMVLPAGVPVPQDRLIHPRVEPEIVFVMGERLAGPRASPRPRRWPRWAPCTAASRSSTAGTGTSGSRWPTSWPTTRRRAPSSPAASASRRTGWTWRWRRACSRSTGRSSTRPPARRSRATRPRRSRWPPTTWAAGVTRSSPAGSCSPAA